MVCTLRLPGSSKMGNKTHLGTSFWVQSPFTLLRGICSFQETAKAESSVV